VTSCLIPIGTKLHHICVRQFGIDWLAHTPAFPHDEGQGEEVSGWVEWTCAAASLHLCCVAKSLPPMRITAHSVSLLHSLNNRCNYSVFFSSSWNAVATWKWDAKDDTCGICRQAFDGSSP
jgi:hypothetical protein